jgi:hypothetical protein
MKAVMDGAFCGVDCKGSTWQGSLIYFPEGKYLVSKPIIMSYYTVIAGHPVHRPTIVGSANFQGIALIDTNLYIEGAYGNTRWDAWDVGRRLTFAAGSTPTISTGR